MSWSQWHCNGVVAESVAAQVKSFSVWWPGAVLRSFSLLNLLEVVLKCVVRFTFTAKQNIAKQIVNKNPFGWNYCFYNIWNVLTDAQTYYQRNQTMQYSKFYVIF